MNIKLIRLVLENFKGTKYFELITDGKDVSVFGDNETGKTTIADAFFWLLFNKNSKGDTKFAIKTLDSKGKEIHNLNHSVYGVLEIDGKEHHIKKVYREKWTQKRGQPTATFSGHETLYELGSSEQTLTPKKLKEFNEYIKTIVADEYIFKLVTNPLAFNSLKPAERKDILMSLVAEVTDDDVINSNSNLSKLKGLMGDNSLDEFKLRISRDKKAINEKLTAIPHRIDEINHNMPDIAKLDKKTLLKDKTDTEKKIEAVRTEISEIKSGNDVIKINGEITQLETDLKYLVDNHDKDSKRALSDKEYELNKQERICNDLKSELSNIKNAKERLDDDKSFLEKDYRQLIEKYKDESNHTKEFKTQTICECCGQDIPEHMQQEAIKKMQEQFNFNKSTLLEQIKEDIQRTKVKAAEIKEQESKLEEQESKTIKSLEAETNKLTELKAEVNKAKAELSDVQVSKAYKNLWNELESKRTARNTLTNSNMERVINVEDEKLRPLLEQLKSIDTNLNDIDVNLRAAERIKELEATQTQLAMEFEELEHAIYLTEEFTKAKVNLMETTINNMFEITEFKLFDIQINGGVNDVCEATYKGVPFDAGLNTAHRINVGLDIINTLSKHYDFYAPIMIDNAESVTDILATESQQVKLHVSEKDKTLRVEEK